MGDRADVQLHDRDIDWSLYGDLVLHEFVFEGMRSDGGRRHHGHEGSAEMAERVLLGSRVVHGMSFRYKRGMRP